MPPSAPPLAVPLGLPQPAALDLAPVDVLAGDHGSVEAYPRCCRQPGQFHHKRRKLFAQNWLCMFNAEKTGLTPPISLEDFVRLPHVLTSLSPGRSVRGIVDDALEKLGLRRSVVLTTPSFLTVPSLVGRAPVIVTMQARLARLFAAEFGLILSPLRWSCMRSRYRCCGIGPTITIRFMLACGSGGRAGCRDGTSAIQLHAR